MWSSQVHDIVQYLENILVAAQLDNIFQWNKYGCPETVVLALFTSADGKIRIEIRLQDDNLRLTPRQIAEWYEKTPPTINEHLKNIYDEGELEQDSTIRKFRIVALEGKRELARLKIKSVICKLNTLRS